MREKEFLPRAWIKRRCDGKRKKRVFLEERVSEREKERKKRGRRGFFGRKSDREAFCLVREWKRDRRVEKFFGRKRRAQRGWDSWKE